MSFQIFTDSSSELTRQHREELKIDFYRMGILVNGKEYTADINWEEYTPETLYDWIRDPNVELKTSLVTVEEFVSRSKPYLDKGLDILYIGCTDRLSGTINVFDIAKEQLQKEYPNRKIMVVNSYRAEMSLGMICMEVARLRDEGKSIEEAAKWVEDNRQYFHQVGSVATLKYLKAAGRVSGVKAFFGNMMSIKPVICFDVHGHVHSFKSVMGSKKALDETIEYIKQHMVPGVTDIVYIGQADAKDSQEYLKQRIQNELGLKTEEFWIGPIVGISCGPGMYGCWFKGDLVTIDAEAEGNA